MSWVTVIWSMIASACLTLAAMHLLVWCKKRTAWANLLFSLTAVATAAMAGCELWMMRAETPEQFATALRWLHVPAWALIVSLVGFVRLHLRAGRPWLAWTICALRTFSLLLNFLVGQNLNYREVTRLRHIPFLGESVSVGEGVSNPWMLVGQLSLLLFVVFVADATITVWRRGDRRQALVVGGSIVFFVLAGTVQAVLVLWQIVHWPMTPSFFYLGIVAAMGYEMSREALRAAQLSDDLRESEAEAMRQRDELAHLSRVTMLSELSGSLAHELNQPLAIILTNAQAAQRLLAQQPPDLAEARDILADIVSEDQRAGEVIRRLRSLLKHGETSLQPLAVNDIIEEVLQLARNDLIGHGITVHRSLAANVPQVLGDHIQLQQVLLNLILNACDAMAANPPARRHLTAGDGAPRWRGADFRFGHRLRPAAGRGTHFRAVLHHQEARPGPGAVHLPLHRHRAQGPACGRKRTRRQTFPMRHDGKLRRDLSPGTAGGTGQSGQP